MTNRLYSHLLMLVALLSSGMLQAQTCNADITETSPSNRFVINGNGTVTDNQTDLVWMRCSLGQAWDGITCTGTASIHDWQDALNQAESNSFIAVTDWRLPSMKELASIVEGACTYPAINESIFPANNLSSSVSWTSSPYAYYSFRAWVVNFAQGGLTSTSKNNTYPLRLVRGGL